MDERAINELFARICALEILVAAAVQQLDTEAFKSDLAEQRALAMTAFEYSKSDEAIERLTKQLDRLETALGLRP
jgi:hypothetical protein